MKAQAPQIRRCVIYTRKSIAKGLDQEFNSLDAQADVCMKFIERHKDDGWVYTGTYVDAAVSGTTVEREQLTALRRLVKAGAVDCIVVYKLDRLSRDLADFSILMKEFAENGVIFESTTQCLQSDTPEGKLSMNMMAVVADYEAAIIRARLRDKIRATRARGRWVGGRPPYGYQLTKQGLQIVPGEADVVRLIYDLHEQGMNVGDIAVRLNEAKHQFRSIGKKPASEWHGQIVKRILMHPVYAGFLRDGDELIKGIHVPFIAEKQYFAAVKRLEESVRHKPQKKHDVLFPLKGLLRCSMCGNEYIGVCNVRSGILRRYYVCKTKAYRSKEKCESPRFNADQMERFVAKQLGTLRDNPNLSAAIIGQLPEFDAHRVADCLYSLDLILEGATLQELDRVFHAAFKSISIDPETSQLNVTLNDL